VPGPLTFVSSAISGLSRLAEPHVTQKKGRFFVSSAPGLTRTQTQGMEAGEDRQSTKAGGDPVDLRNVTCRGNSSHFGTPPAGIASEVALTDTVDREF
jgi:hypothetical protein